MVGVFLLDEVYFAEAAFLEFVYFFVPEFVGDALTEGEHQFLLISQIEEFTRKVFLQSFNIQPVTGLDRQHISYYASELLRIAWWDAFNHPVRVERSTGPRHEAA